MQVDDNQPVYPMGVAARLVGVHPRTLRIYEAEGLIKPYRYYGKRYFSQSDLVWIQCIRSLIHDENIGIEGIKRLLKYVPCWKIKNCSEEVRNKCPALKKMNKKCWEFTENTCENSCKHCQNYIDQQ